MSLTANLVGNITLTDSVSGTVQLTKPIVGVSFLGTVSTYANQLEIGTSPTSIGLPISPTQFIYVKNLTPTTSTNTVTVTWTPNGGSSAVVVLLEPGAFILLGGPTTGGISALSVTASTSSTPIEYILVG